MKGENDGDALKPLTFKVTQFMNDKIEAIVDEGEYESKAELIREAIQKLIDWELKIPTLAVDFKS